MFLSKEFFNWSYVDFEATGVDPKYLHRAHDIWRHAKNRLMEAPTEFDRTDCILALKRAVNSRLKSISHVYGINDLPNTRSKKLVLEKYQDYGLIRPAILKGLFELRNILEHEDIMPPDIDKCKYYIDIVWYFIKSTDGLMQMKPDCLAYGESFDSFLVYFKPERNWEIYLAGEVERSLLFEQEVANTFELDDFEIREISKKPGVVHISGKPRMTEELLVQFARDYFGSMGYWYEDHV